MFKIYQKETLYFLKDLFVLNVNQREIFVKKYSGRNQKNQALVRLKTLHLVRNKILNKGFRKNGALKYFAKSTVKRF